MTASMGPFVSLGSAVLDGMTADVYVLDYAHPAAMQCGATALSPQERARADRYLRPEDRARFVARRGFVRSLLGARLGMAPASLRLAIGPSGQPILEPSPDASGAAPLAFSVSTSHRYAVVALSDRPIGVDIEDVRAGVWDRAAASYVLSETELAWVEAQADPDLAFLRCWTRKEAFAKLDGVGLFDGINQLTLPPLCGRSDTIVREIESVVGAQIAVAQSCGPPVRRLQVSPER